MDENAAPADRRYEIYLKSNGTIDVFYIKNKAEMEEADELHNYYDESSRQTASTHNMSYNIGEYDVHFGKDEHMDELFTTDFDFIHHLH